MVLDLREAFQVQQTSQPSCPVGSLVGLPNNIAGGITVNDTIYNTVYDPIYLDFRWFSSTVVPILAKNTDSGKATVKNIDSYTDNHILYLGFKYILSEISIVSASHKNWLISQEKKNNNEEDIVLKYNIASGSDADHGQIIFIIPVIRTTDTSAPPPSFLSGLTTVSVPGPFNPRDCLPSTKEAIFGYHITCLEETATTKNALVFVAIDGMVVNETIMNAIRTIYGGAGATSFPAIESFKNNIQGRTIPVIDTIPLLNKYIRSSRINLDTDATTKQATQTGIREDQTNAYKCMPFDPANQIMEGGKIKVNLENGEVMTAESLEKLTGEVAAAREEVAAIPLAVSPGVLEKIVAWTFASVLGGGLLFTLLYFAYKAIMAWRGGDTGAAETLAAATTATTAAPSIEPGSPFIKYGLYILGSVIVFIVGIVIGAYVR